MSSLQLLQLFRQRLSVPQVRIEVRFAAASPRLALGACHGCSQVYQFHTR